MSSNMEINTEIKENIRWHTVKGVIDIAKLTDYLKQIYNSSNFDSNMDTFWNLLEADFSSVMSKDVQELSRFVREYWGKEGKSKSALIVPNDLGFGLSRMYETLSDADYSSEISIFKDIDEAKKWIKSD